MHVLALLEWLNHGLKLELLDGLLGAADVQVYKAAQTKLTVFLIFLMREGGQYSQYLGRWGRGLVSCSRFSAERLLQKGHLFASGDAKSSNTGMLYQYLPSGKKHLARSTSARSQDIA